MSVINIARPTRPGPINPTDFANSMTSRIQSLNPDFHCGGKIKEGFTQYGAAYNDCVHMNSIGQDTQFVIPAATGTGKSVSATLYLSQIAQMGMSGLLVVSEVPVAIEAAETINSIAGEEVAGAYYSISPRNPLNDLWRSIDDLPRVTIITHAMFIQRSDSGKDIAALRSFRGKQRDAIIIDERIDLIKRVRFGVDEVYEAIGILKRDSRLHGYAEILNDFNDFIFTTKTNVANRNMGELKDWHNYLRDSLRTLGNNITAGHYNLVQRMDGKKSNPASDIANVKCLLKRIIYVISDNYEHTVEGRNVVCHREENLSGMFGSVVVLDATSQVNPEYDYRAVNGHNIKMFNRITSRDYSNVTLNICDLKGPKQSKRAIYSIPKKQKKHIAIIHCYLKVIGELLTPGDQLLVVTYKDIVPLFEEHNPYKDQVKFIYWGSKDARGSNAFMNFNKAMVVGWYRKPAHNYVASVMAINPFDHYVSSTGSVMLDANHLKDMLIVDDMIQFFNRVRCRTAIDNQGNCLPVELYCLTGGNDAMEQIIRASTESEMPNIVIADWKPKGLKVLKQKITKNEERAENFVMWLRGKIEKQEEISLVELRQEFGLQPNIIARVIKSDFFQDLLEEEGITMTKTNAWGNPVRFILPRHTI